MGERDWDGWVSIWKTIWLISRCKIIQWASVHIRKRFDNSPINFNLHFWPFWRWWRALLVCHSRLWLTYVVTMWYTVYRNFHAFLQHCLFRERSHFRCMRRLSSGTTQREMNFQYIWMRAKKDAEELQSITSRSVVMDLKDEDSVQSEAKDCTLCTLYTVSRPWW